MNNNNPTPTPGPSPSPTPSPSQTQSGQTPNKKKVVSHYPELKNEPVAMPTLPPTISEEDYYGIVDCYRVNQYYLNNSGEGRIEYIINDDKIRELINNYVDKTLESIVDDESLDDVSLENDMIDYISDNRKVIEESTGVEITDEMIAQLRESFEDKHISRMFKESINYTRNSISTREKTVLKGYKYLISFNFRLLLVVLIIASLVIIAVIKKSFYEWIKNLYYSLILSGVGLIAIGIILKIIIKVLTGLSKVHAMPLIIIGIVYLVIGIIILILYSIIIKKLMKGNEENVVS